MAKKSTSKKKPSVKRAPKTKKKTDFKTSEQRSVFLYGKPNKEKLAKLSKIQNDYTAASQHYVDLLADNEDFLLPLLKHDRKGHELRSLEKANRVSYLTSALSQSAFDHAVDMVANRLDNIKSYVYENAPSVLSSSKVLFAMCVQNKSKNEMISAFKDIVENIHKQDEEKLKEGKTPQQGKDKFYIDTIAELESMNDCTFNANADAVRLYYYEGTAIFRVPTIKHASVRLVSTLYTLEKSKNIEAPYVISVTDPSSRGKRIDVPLNTSRNSLRRLDQYGAKHSVDYTIRKDGLIKVTVAFEKKHITPEVKKLRGVDVGTNDALHTSDDKAFGSFDQCAKFYDEQVLPLAGVRSSILNKKRAIKHYLHTHKNLPDNVKKDLRDKMDRLEAMLRRDKEY
ncbi:MAG: hypothetical protein LUC89_06550, partial [Oscillospiraceae bacterium]|nr:hypothetical protein [Oscillospiraceae bacterium]